MNPNVFAKALNYVCMCVARWHLPLVMDTLRGGGAENVFVAFIFVLVRRNWMLVRSWMLIVAKGCGILEFSVSFPVPVPWFPVPRARCCRGESGGGGGPVEDPLASSLFLRAPSSLSSSASSSSPWSVFRPWMSKLSTDLRVRFLHRHASTRFENGAITFRNVDLSYLNKTNFEDFFECLVCKRIVWVWFYWTSLFRTYLCATSEN